MATEDKGWIKLWRQAEDDPLYFAEPFTRYHAWIDLLLMANHKPGVIYKRGIRLNLDRGDVGMSELELSKRWRWSRGKVRRFLSEMESEKEQKIVQQKSNLTTCIHIVNYGKYQGNGTPDGHQTDTRRYRNKNEKNEKKIPIGENSSCPYEEIVSLYHECLPELPQIVKLTDTRKKQVQARWNESEKTCHLEWWEGFFKYIKKSPFLKGENNRGWKADLEWITKASNFVKIVEGQYHALRPM